MKKIHALVFLSFLFAIAMIQVVYAEPLYPNEDLTPLQRAMEPNIGTHYDKVNDHYLAVDRDTPCIQTAAVPGAYGNMDFFASARP
jgi:hypothetical protein